MKELSAEETYLNAFADTVSMYQEREFASGSLGAMNYGQNTSGKATNTGSSATIVLAPMEIAADVQMAARRVLSPYVYSYWLAYYQDAHVTAVTAADIRLDGRDVCLEAHIATFPLEQQAAIRTLDRLMRLTLGQHFIEIKMYPDDEYRAPYDARQPKTPKQFHRFSHLY